MLKIAVYTIALNEAKHIERWWNSAKDSDLLLIADTGSTDGTPEIAEKFGIKVHRIKVEPWRFDIARNASLALIPEDVDICIQLDMDEVLPDEWRSKIEAAWEAGNTWPIYRHVTARYPNGDARYYQHYFKIHPRQGFFWKYPIHEILVPKDGVSYRRELIDLEVDHLKDDSKNRNSYLSLLELAVREMPEDWRMAHYLIREYWYLQDWNKILRLADSALRIKGGWDIERASTCMWASDAAQNLGFSDWALDWARRGTTEAPKFYETWHFLAHLHHLRGEWQQTFDAASKILVLDRQDHHLVKPDVWEWWGYDLFALASHRLGDNKRAVHYGQKALTARPGDKRLKDNLNFYEEFLIKSLSNSGATAPLMKSEYPIPDSPNGGTEILLSQLKKYTQFEESEFNLITSIADPNRIDKSKINILWQHLNVDQAGAQGMKSETFLDSLDAIVFVSHWQYHQFRGSFKLPENKCHVIKNAIEPLGFVPKIKSEKFTIAYTSTPWRGLEILLDSFEQLNRDDLELHVYSSTALYGRHFYELNDKDWQHLYERARGLKNVIYRGYVPHETLRFELFQFDLLAYPSIWAETFCLAAVEAGAAGGRILTTDLGALPEVLGEKATCIPYSSDRKVLSRRFAEQLNAMIDDAKKSDLIGFRQEQHEYFNSTFSWERRKDEWNYLFRTLKRSK